MRQKAIQLLTIGKLAERTGISTDTLRYYEKMGLIKAASRSEAGYRIYGEDAERILQFIKGAKTLNFTLEEIRQLLTLNRSDKATCAEVLRQRLPCAPPCAIPLLAWQRLWRK